jgi:O-antigen/teichoic acid export membrane protein
LGRLTGYLTAASGRPTQALKWTIANRQASTDYDEKRRSVGSAVSVWLIFLPVLTTLGAVLVWFIPIWLDVPPDLAWLVRFAAGLLVARLIVTSLFAIPRSVLEGENLGYKRMGLSTTLVFLGGGLTVLALRFDAGLIGVAAASLTTVLVTGVLFLLVVRTHVPWFGIARPSAGAVRQFFGLSGWFLVWNLLIQLMRASDLVILGIFASVELVTVYTLTKYIPETLISFVAIVVFGITPGLGGIIGSGKLQKAAQVRGEIMLLTWLIIVIAGTVVLIWNQAFLALWVGAEYYAGPMVTLLVLIMMAQFVLIRNDANIIDLTLNLSQKVLLGLASVVLSLVMAIGLVGYFDAGITGLVLGFIAGRSILSLAYPLIIGHFLGITPYSQFKGVLRPVLITVLLFSLALRLGLNASTWFIAETWIGLFISMAVTLGAVSVLAFFWGLTGDQRNRTATRFRSVLRSRT